MNVPVSDGETIYFNREVMMAMPLDAMAFGIFAHLACLGRTVRIAVQDMSREVDQGHRVVAAGLRKLALMCWIRIEGDGPVRTIEINQDVAVCAGHWEGSYARAASYRRVANLWDPKRRSVSASVRRRILMRRGERCCYCGSEAGPWHIDHRLAVALGGDDDDRNLVVACGPCNLSKGAKPLREWRKRNG